MDTAAFARLDLPVNDASIVMLAHQILARMVVSVSRLESREDLDASVHLGF